MRCGYLVSQREDPGDAIQIFPGTTLILWVILTNRKWMKHTVYKQLSEWQKKRILYSYHRHELCTMQYKCFLIQHWRYGWFTCTENWRSVHKQLPEWQEKKTVSIRVSQGHIIHFLKQHRLVLSVTYSHDPEGRTYEISSRRDEIENCTVMYSLIECFKTNQINLRMCNAVQIYAWPENKWSIPKTLL